MIYSTHGAKDSSSQHWNSYIFYYLCKRFRTWTNIFMLYVLYVFEGGNPMCWLTRHNTELGDIMVMLGRVYTRRAERVINVAPMITWRPWNPTAKRMWIHSLSLQFWMTLPRIHMLEGLWSKFLITRSTRLVYTRPNYTTGQVYVPTYYIHIKTVTCNNLFISISPFFSARHVSASYGHPQVLSSEIFHTAYVW
jgi:hypothetical protein